MTCWPRTPETPACLTPGDRIAVVSPSWGGPSVFPHRFDAGIDFVARTFGLEVVEMEHVRAPAQWLATHPEARAGDLMTAFADISISAIVASIGGDDAIRLLPYLDLNVISKNPKVFVGYSDATVLHFACLKAGIGSFYGPTVMAGFAENGGMHEYSVSSVLSILFSGDVPGEISSNTNGWTDEVLDWANPSNQNRKRMLNPCEPPRLLQGKGKVEGRLIGGCAEVLEMIKGTSLWPPIEYWDRAILFYETSEDAPSPTQVKRWVRNLGAQGILERLSGIILGRPGGGIARGRHGEYGEAVGEVLAEYGARHVALLTGLDFGHTDPMMTLPYGRMAKIDCDRQTFSILEPAVKAI